MIRRLVLGDGSLGRTVTDRTTDQPGELYVVTGDSGWVTTLREKQIAAIEGDPADPTHYPSAADVVVVAAAEGPTTERIATVAREKFPAATIVAAVGVDGSKSTRD